MNRRTQIALGLMVAYCVSVAIYGLYNYSEADSSRQQLRPFLLVVQFVFCIVLLRQGKWLGFWLNVATCCCYGGAAAYSAWVILVSGQVVKLGVLIPAGLLGTAIVLFSAAILLLSSWRAFEVQEADL